MLHGRSETGRPFNNRLVAERLLITDQRDPLAQHANLGFNMQRWISEMQTFLLALGFNMQRWISEMQTFLLALGFNMQRWISEMQAFLLALGLNMQRCVFEMQAFLLALGLNMQRCVFEMQQRLKTTTRSLEGSEGGDDRQTNLCT